MPRTLNSLSELADLGFDDVLDVRSPSEYAEDHVPGAVNLPVLDDDERARVGTIYVRESRFLARRVGAALVAQNAARHLEGYLADKGPGYRPLVYCWRGGQRSGAFATILSQVGWRVETLDGGYRSYRRLVKQALYDAPFPAPVIVLDGNTGTAKTALLRKLQGAGVQVIDLENLANHRGSLFGFRPGGQPSQKAFESALAEAVSGLDRDRPVVVEAESSKIGERIVPPSLWEAMGTAPRIEIVVPLRERARYLARAYADVARDRRAFARAIDRLRPYHPAETIDLWHRLLSANELEDLAAQLMVEHYDPRYAKQRARTEGAPAPVHIEDLSEGGLKDAASRVSSLVLDLAGNRAGGSREADATGS